MVISHMWEIQIKRWNWAWWVFLLAIIIIIPSTREVHRFLGSAGLIVYALGVLVALAFLRKVIVHRFFKRISESQVKWLAVLTVVALIALVATVFPLADSGQIAGGSDRDEALTSAAHEMMRGRYAYTPEDYGGGPITPLPGAIFLAVPFVLIGNVAFQNVFWLGVAFLVFRSYFNDGRMALLLLWTILALAPVVLQQVVTGSDLVSNILYLVAFMWLLYRSTNEGSNWRGQGVIASILLGVGLASRLNYLLLAPLIFAMVIRRKGWKEGATYSLITASIFIAISLPFYLYDTEGFSPLHVQHRSFAFPSVRHISVVLGTPAIVLATILTLRFQGSGFRSLMINCALVQFALLMPFFILTTYHSSSLQFAFSDFGIVYLIFGALAIWPIVAPDHDSEQLANG